MGRGWEGICPKPGPRRSAGMSLPPAAHMLPSHLHGLLRSMLCSPDATPSLLGPPRAVCLVFVRPLGQASRPLCWESGPLAGPHEEPRVDPRVGHSESSSFTSTRTGLAPRSRPRPQDSAARPLEQFPLWPRDGSTGRPLGRGVPGSGMGSSGQDAHLISPEPQGERGNEDLCLFSSSQ